MRRTFLGLMLVGLAGCADAPPPAAPPPPAVWSADVQEVADGNNRFALDLYRELAAEPGNVFVSPFSAHAALSMTATGANGPTRDEMVKVLHLPADPAKALAAGDLSRHYAAGGPGYELAVANALWGQKGLPWKADFLAVQKDRFAAGFNEADFRADPEAERLRVNAWAEENTRGRIKDLLKPDNVTKLTRMVLTNAVYFKGQWATQFDKRWTENAPFTLADKGTATVPLMIAHVEVPCAEFDAAYLPRQHSPPPVLFPKATDPRAAPPPRDGFQLIRLPYRGDGVEMVVVLPRSPDGLPAVAAGLTAEKLSGMLAERPKRSVNLFLPRLTFEQRFSAKKTLQQMGMIQPFQEGADFTGMVDRPRGQRGLYIADVIHKAFVEVNEEGTEAAAATAVIMAESVSFTIPPRRSSSGPTGRSCS